MKQYIVTKDKNNPHIDCKFTVIGIVASFSNTDYTNFKIDKPFSLKFEYHFNYLQSYCLARGYLLQEFQEKDMNKVDGVTELHEELITSLNYLRNSQKQSFLALRNASESTTLNFNKIGGLHIAHENINNAIELIKTALQQADI
jgi:hypothetical protein